MGRCYNSTIIDASPERVWEAIRDFHDLAWAEGVVTSVVKVGDRGGLEPGAKRLLNEAFHETLLTLDDEHRVLTYSIDDGPGPLAKDAVNNYIGRVEVLPVTVDGTTYVGWESTYESNDPGAVGDLCNPIYMALLKAMKDHFA